jgi:hypothetical protein
VGGGGAGGRQGGWVSNWGGASFGGGGCGPSPSVEDLLDAGPVYTVVQSECVVVIQAGCWTARSFQESQSHEQYQATNATPQLRVCVCKLAQFLVACGCWQHQHLATAAAAESSNHRF